MENHTYRGPDRLAPLQTEWTLALGTSVMTLNLLCHLPRHLPLTPRAPRTQTNPALSGRGLQAPRQRQAWCRRLTRGYMWRRLAGGEEGCEEEPLPVEFQKDFLEERTPRNHGSKQREEALCILNQTEHGDQGVSGEEDLG